MSLFPLVNPDRYRWTIETREDILAYRWQVQQMNILGFWINRDFGWAATEEQAEREALEMIELFRNPPKPHVRIGYVPPLDDE